MSNLVTWQQEEMNSLRSILIGHGGLVLAISLVAGIPLIFAMLGSVTLWPFPGLEITMPGSVQGWRTLHVGGIINGILIMGMGVVLAHVALSYKIGKFVTWSLVYTGWANMAFYWFGNLSSNRGLSVVDTPYGKGDWAGAAAYFAGGSAMLFTISAALIIAFAAFRQAKYVKGEV